MTKDEFVVAVARLIAGLQVPVSMGMPLGAATEPWTELHRNFAGFGWAKAEDYETAIRELLEGPDE